MSPEQHKRVEELFLRVSDHPEAERRALLDALDEDTAVIAEVRSLLGHHGEDAGFLDNAELLALSLGLGQGVRLAEEQTLPAGTRVGDFTIQRALGSGGMGMVYVAEQERPRRTVALKVIRRGFGTSGLVRRFEHEAEVLGRLQHPGIAQIFEAGTADLSGAGGLKGQPFIAMELVKGPPLNEHAERQKLGTRERLELVVRVCEAVQHAHQRGVIHRDLKPANILVDEQGRPKVLDFGVARITDSDLHVTTLRTSVGQLIGTLPYMSPEQVLADPREVDTRSDVYSLGVVLYQLLTGKLPHDLSSRSIPEAARVIRDEAPARLSAVSRVFRGEIETIVAKALSKDKERRYQSAADLGEDIRRYLEGKPIAAKDDSALYILRTQLKRYRGAVAAGLVFVAALIVFAAVASVQAGRNSRLAEHNRKLADAERDARGRLASELSSSNIERGRLQGYLGSMRPAEEQLWPELFRDPGSIYPRWALRELYMQLPCLCTLTVPMGNPDSLDLSPNGTLLASGEPGGVVRVWDVRTARERVSFKVADRYSPGVRFIPGGPLVAVAGAVGLEVWDPTVSPPARRSAFPGFTSKFIAVSDDGTIILGSVDGSVRLLHAGSAELEELARPGPAEIRGVDITPDGRLAGWVHAGGDFRVHSLATGETRTAARLRLTAFSPRFSRDGRFVAIGGGDRAARVVNVETGETVRTVQFGSDGFRCVALSPEGDQLVTGNWWGVEVWRVADGERVRALAAHRGDTVAVGFSRDGSLLATSGADGTIRVWEMKPARARRIVTGPSAPASGMCLSPDGRRLAISGADGTIRIHDAAGLASRPFPTEKDPAPPVVLAGDGVEVGSLQFDSAGTLLVGGTAKGSVEVWELATGKRRFLSSGHKSEVFATEFVEGGRRVVSGGRDGRVLLWDLATGESAGAIERRRPEMAVVGQVMKNPAGDRLVVLPGGKEIPEIDLSGNRTGVYVLDGSAWCGAWSPDGTRVAIGTWAGSIEVFDTQTRQRVGVLRGLDRLVTAVGYSGDGSLLAAASAAGETKMWEAATERFLATFPGTRQGKHIVAIAFRGQDLLLTASDDGEAAAWDLGYYDHHIAGNLAHQMDLLKPRPAARAVLEEWAKGVAER